MTVLVLVPGIDISAFLNSVGAFVVSDIVAEPNGSESADTCYLVAALGLGEFEGYSNNIAILTANNGWEFVPPKDGMTVVDSTGTYLYDAGAWTLIIAPGPPDPGTQGTVIWASKYFVTGAASELAAADAAAGASGTVVLDPGSNFTLSTATTLGGGKYVPLGGTIITGANALTFTKALPPETHTRMFDAAGTGLIKWAGNGGSIYDGLYGVVADDKFDGSNLSPTDDTNALNRVHASIKAWINGGTLVHRGGWSAVYGNLVFDCSVGSLNNAKAFHITGPGRGASGFRSHVTSGIMMMIGSPTVNSPAAHVTVEHVGFISAALPGTGGEATLLWYNYCNNGTLFDCWFYGGHDNQFTIGRPQGVKVISCLFAGGIDPSGVYYTNSGVVLTQSVAVSGQKAGQDVQLIGDVIRDFRNSTHTGVALNFVFGGGSEHDVLACNIENSDIISNVDENLITFRDCQCESRGFMAVATQGAHTGTGVLTVPALQFGNNTGTFTQPGIWTLTATGATTATLSDPSTPPNTYAVTVGTTYSTTVAPILPLGLTLTGAPVNGDVWTIAVTHDIGIRVGNGGTAISLFKAYGNKIEMTGLANCYRFLMLHYFTADIQGNDLIGGDPTAKVWLGADSGLKASTFANNSSLVQSSIGFDPALVGGKWDIWGNLDSTDQTPYRDIVPDGLATPNVANSKMIEFTYTNPQTITNLLWGSIGRPIVAFFGSGNVTIQHGTNFRCPGGENLLVPTNRYLMFTPTVGGGAGNTVVYRITELPSTNSERKAAEYNGDAPASLSVGLSAQNQIWNIPLTAQRNVTFDATTRVPMDGEQFLITRTAAATGASNLVLIFGAGNKNLVPGSWARAVYTADVANMGAGAGWYLAENGTL